MRLERTAKSCGSGAAVLALSSRKQAFANDGGKKAVLREEHDISRKAIAQGRPECFRRTCMLVCAFSVRNCTRDRGCGAHPVFPAPSNFREGEKLIANLGRSAPREGETVSIVIARSEATKQSIYPRAEAWIASLRSQ